MYMDYSKLWKFLIDKGMSKSDLMALTGISSRVLAKLSKNQIVTTDTLARICTALSCDISDIMECVSEEQLSLYTCYRKSGTCTGETENCLIVEFEVNSSAYLVYVSKQSATKATHIHCREDGAIYWEQFYPIGYINNSETHVLIKPPRDEEKNLIVLIKGRPAVVTGLDENGFISSRGSRTSDTDIYVMSEAAFKLFSPQQKSI